MKTYKFEARHQYTSYSKLTSEQEKAIEAGNYDNIPIAIIVNNKTFLISDLLIEDKKYVEVLSGIKMKYETIRISPDYRKENGCGEHVYQLKIKTDKEVKFIFEDSENE